MHTIIPGMVMKDGQAVMPYGVMGGHFQPMGHSLFLTNMLEYGLDIQEALDLPRLFPLRGKVQVERGIPREIGEALVRLGHELEAAGSDRMAGARRSGSTAPAAASSAGRSPARTGWRWDTDRKVHHKDTKARKWIFVPSCLCGEPDGAPMTEPCDLNAVEARRPVSAALASSTASVVAIRTLRKSWRRRPPDEPDETCWLAGDGWWLSTAPPEM